MFISYLTKYEIAPMGRFANYTKYQPWICGFIPPGYWIFQGETLRNRAGGFGLHTFA